jgi:hypothetical protein
MQHRVLHQAAREWLAAGTLLGKKQGLFGADAQGRIQAQ